ncbi:MAG: hypothetical protein AAGJ08_03095 [Cyanobacteria bacterium P01_H01_bin.35]
MADSDIFILKQMIQPTAIEKLKSTKYQKKIVELREESDNYTLTIHGMPDDDEVIVIKVDAFRAPTTIFQGSRGECKRADFVIIADTINKEKFIIFIEMKGGQNASGGDIIKQLKGAQCFVEYCQAIGKLFWDKQDFLDDYKYRFASFKDIKISKKTTRPKSKYDIHDTPENMLKISSQNSFYFKNLIGHKKHKK